MKKRLLFTALIGTVLLVFWTQEKQSTINFKEPEMVSFSSINSNSDKQKRQSTQPLDSESSPELKKLESTLAHYFECEKITCGFKDDDPREYEIERGKRILKLFSELKNKNSQLVKTHSEIVEKALGDLNPYIQQGALEALRDSPPSSKLLGTLLDSGLDSQSPRIVEQVFLELLKYRNKHTKSEINMRYLNMLKKGPLVSRNVIVDNLAIILDKDTHEFFSRRLNEITNRQIRLRVQQILGTAKEHI